MIDHLSKRFTNLYEPHREVAVDEAMIKFNGHSSVKQYMPMKPIKRRIKVYATCCSHTHTVLHTIHVHAILYPHIHQNFSDINTHMYACTYTHTYLSTTVKWSEYYICAVLFYKISALFHKKIV